MQEINLLRYKMIQRKLLLVYMAFLLKFMLFQMERMYQYFDTQNKHEIKLEITTRFQRIALLLFILEKL